jgi:hypothetical protein
LEAHTLLIESFSSEDKVEAKKVEEQIDSATSTILSATRTLASNYARLGSLLNQVRERKFWLLGNYKSFGEYIKFVEKKYDIGHSQLYLGISIAQNLSPLLSEDTLCEIGITKAGVLSKYAEQSGVSTIPEDLMALATDPKKKVDELRGECALKLHNILPEEKGRWRDVGGFFASDEEWREWTQAIEIAKSVDPAIPHDQPEWLQLKQAALRLAQEFVGTWGNG